MPLGYFRFMDQPIRSRVATEEYRKNWEKVFRPMEKEPEEREYAVVTPTQADALSRLGYKQVGKYGG